MHLSRALLFGLVAAILSCGSGVRAERRAQLEAARYELTLYDEQLKQADMEIQKAREVKPHWEGPPGGPQTWKNGPTSQMLKDRAALNEKVIQLKVKVRELETLVNN